MPWVKRKPPRCMAVGFVKCHICGRIVKQGNFCNQCGYKLRFYCKCWVLHKEFNCGQGNRCPGLEVFEKMVKAERDSKEGV